MDITQNKESVRSFFQHLNDQEMPEAFQMLSEDLHWWILGSTPVSGEYDKRKISLGLKMLHRNFENYKFTIGQMTAEENRVSVILESHAKRKSNGKAYNNHFHFLISFENGKIVKVKEFFDTAHVIWIEES